MTKTSNSRQQRRAHLQGREEKLEEVELVLSRYSDIESL
jgi:hypothetical protein